MIRSHSQTAAATAPAVYVAAFAAFLRTRRPRVRLRTTGPIGPYRSAAAGARLPLRAATSPHPTTP